MMFTAFRSCLSPPLIRAVVLILPLVLGAGGCSWRKGHIPPAAPARKAVEDALSAWQKGHAVGMIETASPPVQAVDSGWGAGQELASYEILEEVSRPDGKRCFKVRLHLQNPSRDQEVHYLVVGKSPLWMYREEDYKRMNGWEGTDVNADDADSTKPQNE
jgi:hypothetical protein